MASLTKERIQEWIQEEIFKKQICLKKDRFY
jgi:hypothetical protein